MILYLQGFSTNNLFACQLIKRELGLGSEVLHDVGQDVVVGY